jgi:exonuclease III
MKLISLNTWGGGAFDALMAFVKEQSRDTDIFCFQEMYVSDGTVPISRGGHMNIFNDIAGILPEFEGIFAEAQDDMDPYGHVDFKSTFGQAIFVNKKLPITSRGSVFINSSRNGMKNNEFENLPMLLQYVRLGDVTVGNCYGVSVPGHKLDTPRRIEQSERVVKFLNEESGKKIICGDFNLMPETESVKMIERAGMRNLISEFSITTTRSTLNYEKYAEGDRQYFADYTFVSPGVNVKSFEVPQVPVSDHLPMVLEFE